MEQEVGRHKIDMWRILWRSREVHWVEMNLFDIQNVIISFNRRTFLDLENIHF